jgi:hypothetical protein
MSYDAEECNAAQLASSRDCLLDALHVSKQKQQQQKTKLDETPHRMCAPVRTCLLAPPHNVEILNEAHTKQSPKGLSRLWKHHCAPLSAALLHPAYPEQA